MALQAAALLPSTFSIPKEVCLSLYYLRFNLRDTFRFLKFEYLRLHLCWCNYKSFQ